LRAGRRGGGREARKLDILVNNAAEQHPDKEITDISEEQLKRTFQTNIFGYFFMVQAARPHLKEGASIINCTSVTMYQGSKELLDYSAPRARSRPSPAPFRKTSASKGISVNAGGARGPIWTPLNPFGRLETPGEDGEFRTSTCQWAGPASRTRWRPSFLFLALARIRATCPGQVYSIPMAAHRQRLSRIEAWRGREALQFWPYYLASMPSGGPGLHYAGTSCRRPCGVPRDGQAACCCIACRCGLWLCLGQPCCGRTQSPGDVHLPALVAVRRLQDVVALAHRPPRPELEAAGVQPDGSVRPPAAGEAYRP
jgi:hypothetical protein